MLSEPVYLLLGSNLGDKRTHLEKAVKELRKRGVEVLRLSSVYASEPWGNRLQDWFENQCVEVRSRETPDGLKIGRAHV